MQTRNLGIELDQGADFNAIIGIFGDAGPIDLTGYQFKSEMRATSDPNSDVVAEFQFTILNQFTNKGQVQMSLPAFDNDESSITTSIATPLTKSRQKTPFIFDVKMQDTNGGVTRIIEGLVYMSPEATQETFS